MHMRGQRALGKLAGDDRGTTSSLDARFRMAVAWDTENGQVSFSVTDSCSAGWRNCHAQFPINARGSANRIQVSGGRGSLEAKYHGLNSKMPVFAADGAASVTLGSDGHSHVTLRGDGYPNFEAYQYTPNGVKYLGGYGGSLNAGATMPMSFDRGMAWNDGTRQWPNPN